MLNRPGRVGRAGRSGRVSAAQRWAIDATAEQILSAIRNPAAYRTDGWLINGVAGARIAANARSSVAMQVRRDDLLGTELVTNGTFDTSTSGWSVSNGSTIAAVGGELEITATGSQNFPGASLSVAVVSGRSYRLTFQGRRGTSSSAIGLSAQTGSSHYNLPFNSTTTNVSGQVDFVATSASLSIQFFMNGAPAGAGTCYVDNVSVREVIVPALGYEFAAHNLLTQSENFSAAAWTAFNVAVSNNAGVSPSGTNTMQRLLRTSTGAGCYLTQTVSGVIGQQVTATVYARVGSVPNSRLGVRIQGTYPDRADAVFDLSAGVVSGSAVVTYTGLSADITALGGGLFRCRVTATVAGTALSQVVAGPTDAFLATGVWESASAILSDAVVWGAQLSLGSSITAYVPTTTTAVYAAAIDWLSGIGAYGVRSEESRTNLALWSRDLTQTAWVKTGGTATLTATGIDGVANAASVFTATSANATALQTITAAALQRTFSVFLRRRTGTGGVDITIDGGTTWVPVTLTGTLARFPVTQTVTNPVVGVRVQTIGDAVDFDVAQPEDGAFATSPILTYGATATRAKDTAEIAVSFNGTATIVADYVPQVAVANIFAATTAYNYVDEYHGFHDSGGVARAEVRSGNVSQAIFIGPTPTVGALHKMALAVAPNDLAFCVDGGTVQTVTTATTPSTTKVLIGQDPSQSVSGATRVVRIRGAAQRLPNAMMQALSA